MSKDKIRSRFRFYRTQLSEAKERIEELERQLNSANDAYYYLETRLSEKTRQYERNLANEREQRESDKWEAENKERKLKKQIEDNVWHRRLGYY